MAQPGFPWSAQSNANEPTYLNEKQELPVQQRNNLADEKPLLDPASQNASSSPPTQNRRHISIKEKRRHGSLKTPNNARPIMSAAPEKAPVKDALAQLPVRTIPPWVKDAEEDDLHGEIYFPDSPHAALVAQHNHAPSSSGTPNQSRSGGHEMSSGIIRAEKTSRWISFARASAYPRERFDNQLMDKEWLDQNFTDYSKPWLADHNEDDDEDGSSRYRAFRRKRQVWYKRSQFTILRNPFIPLAFRLLVLSFAIVAIGLGAIIHYETGKITKCIAQSNRSDFCESLVGVGAQDYYRDPSALMAVIVDAIAVVYTIYITYDEYFSKPLGLRSARAKVRLVLLDLFFIVFQSANLSLSFESLTVEEGACQVGDDPRTSTRFDNVCDRAQALSAVLLLSLFAWLLTFSVSVLRLVERINTR